MAENIDLLRAKDAIFRMIEQFHHCTQKDDGNYYIKNYCESALERCFQVLNFEDDEVPLMEFCQAWEDNNRKIWEYNSISKRPYKGLTAQDYYDYFIENYQHWLKSWDDIAGEKDD